MDPPFESRISAASMAVHTHELPVQNLLQPMEEIKIIGRGTEVESRKAKGSTTLPTTAVVSAAHQSIIPSSKPSTDCITDIVIVKRDLQPHGLPPIVLQPVEMLEVDEDTDDKHRFMVG